MIIELAIQTEMFKYRKYLKIIVLQVYGVVNLTFSNERDNIINLYNCDLVHAIEFFHTSIIL